MADQCLFFISAKEQSSRPSSSTTCQINTALQQGRKPGGKFGGRWPTAFGSKLLTRKTGRVETHDT